MGQALSPDLPKPGISVARASRRSSNGAVTAARFHPRSSARRLRDDYEVSCGVVLGRGRHSSVIVAHSRTNRRKCALKTFRTELMATEALSLMTAEVEIHLTLDHPNTVRLYDVYEGEKEVYMVMECCEGGELYYELMERGQFGEAAAAEATWQMLGAVGYLHAHDVVHRDLKLDNFLYAGRDKKHLRLIDFGFAKVWDGRTKMEAACGTPDYVSPEVLGQEGYTSKCDMWSLGVIVFMLLSGRAPLHAERRELLQRKIRRGEVDWTQLWSNSVVSAEAADFLRNMLVANPARRMDAPTATFHPWLVRQRACREGNIRISPGVVSSLHRYASAPAVRRAVLQLVAQQLGAAETEELTDLFLALVKGSEGTIVMEHLRNTIDRERSLLEHQDEPPPLAPLEREGPLERLFSVLDVNGDGQVYHSEFLAASLGAQLWPSEEAFRAAFSRFDSGCFDHFEGVDSEALLREARRCAGCREGVLGFEAFMQIAQGADLGEENSADVGIEGPCSWPRPPQAPPAALMPPVVVPPGARERPLNLLLEQDLLVPWPAVR